MSTAVSGPRPASVDEIDAELCRRSLREFVPIAWPVIQPDPFVGNWHIDAICEHLEAASAGEIRRLIINIPPRAMKSRTVSVLWPAWSWLNDPSTRWLFGSYSGDLALEHAVESRALIESEGGREEGGTLLERVGYQGLLRMLGAEWEMTGDQNVKSRYRNTAGGSRQSTSVTAKVTGFGGDFIVADDPHNAMEPESEAKRLRVIRWWDQAISTRMNDPKTGVRVVVMQRLHEGDLTGHLLAEERGYEHLCLPMEYEPSHPFVWPDDPRSEPGELLWADHMPTEVLDQFRKDLGSYAYAGQMQQRPAPAEGGILKREWWRYFTEPPQVSEVIESWDMAFKDKADSDYVVGQAWGRDGANKYLLAQVRGRLDFSATKEAVKALAAWTDEHYGQENGARLVEDKANGTAVIAELRDTVSGLIAVEPKGGKEARAHAVSPQVEAGNVHLPESVIPCPVGALRVGDRTVAIEQTRTEELVEEAAAFPNGANDDQIDAMTQALARLRDDSGFVKPRTV